MHESSHKATLTWNIQTLWSILLLYQGIKIMLQFRGYQFVCINHQYPLAGSGIYGSLPCRFTNLIIASREDNNLATIFTGNIQCIIRTLHIADYYLIEVFYGFQNLSQMLRGVIGINNDRNAALYIYLTILFFHNFTSICLFRYCNGLYALFQPFLRQYYGFPHFSPGRFLMI